MTPKKTVSEAMTGHVEKVGIDRRQFFITTAAVGGALVVGFAWPGEADAVERRRLLRAPVYKSAEPGRSKWKSRME